MKSPQWIQFRSGRSGFSASGFIGRVLAAWQSAHQFCSWQVSQDAEVERATCGWRRVKLPWWLKTVVGFSGKWVRSTWQA
jgi:hypothetical protein